MITMQVTDKDMVDSAVSYLISKKLDLSCLTTVDKKQILIAVNQLRSMVPGKGKGG
jgi:hypothetical protein